MITVLAKMTIKEDMVDKVKEMVVELVAETRKEEGCISYQLFQDMKDKRVFTFVEEWESKDALKKHMNTKHFLDAMPKLTEIQEKETEMSINTLVI